jgi:DNA polymerase III subunit gamma/tau
MTFGSGRGSMQSIMPSLYRRYRPQVFGSVLGQEHICSSLVTSLKKDLIGHAYLFSGPRGTGKTTLARLFARAVNCAARQESQDPCNKCDLCVEIGDGRAVDVLEIDAASNRGIDEIRELRERIGFAPTRARYRVYIIDEVHMLTKEAFNALLKTLEEPPAHAIFILATTELHKMPETIVSRCQRYSFHRASSAAIVTLLEEVSKAEKLAIEPEGLKAIAERAEGSYRDSLTLLGNIASHEGNLDASIVRQLLGLPPTQVVEQVLQLILEGETEELARLLKGFLDEGGEVAVLAKALCDLCKQEILHPMRPSLPRPAAAKLLEALLLTLARARHSADPLALIVSQLIRLSLQHQNSFVEARVPSPTPVVVNDVQRVEKNKTEEAPVSVDAVERPASTAPSAPTGDFWPRLLEGVKSHNHALYMVVRAARLEELGDKNITIAVKFRFYVDRLQEIRNRKIIETVAGEIAARALKLETIIRPELDLVGPGGNDAGSGPDQDETVRAVVDVFELEEVK